MGPLIWDKPCIDISYRAFSEGVRIRGSIVEGEPPLTSLLRKICLAMRFTNSSSRSRAVPIQLTSPSLMEF